MSNLYKVAVGSALLLLLGAGCISGDADREGDDSTNAMGTIDTETGSDAEDVDANVDADADDEAAEADDGADAEGDDSADAAAMEKLGSEATGSLDNADAGESDF